MSFSCLTVLYPLCLYELVDWCFLQMNSSSTEHHKHWIWLFGPGLWVFSIVYLQPEETLGWEEEGRKSTRISFSSQQKKQALKPNTDSTPVAAVQFVFLQYLSRDNEALPLLVLSCISNY